MTLKSLTLTNWKSFGEARNVIEFAPLTLLVGPNASGKSNALDALRFLQGAALDYPLGDVLRGRYEGQREIWPAVRGQTVEAARSGHHAFELSTCWQFDANEAMPGARTLEHLLGVDTEADALLNSERISRPSNNYAFDTDAPTLRGAAGRQQGGGIKAALRTQGKGNAESKTYSALRSLLGQVEGGGRVRPDAISDVHDVQAALRGIVFLDIQPARMRDYRPEHASVLGTSGENVSPVLHALDESRLGDVIDWLSELCAPVLEEIDFDTTQLREVMFFFKEGHQHRISARSTSDGTLRFLGLVTALLTAKEGELIVIEEPDVGLHPSRIHLLARLLEQTTSARGVQVIATTHSPTLLAHLSPSSLGHVVAMGRAADTQTTVCMRLRDMEHFDQLRDSKHLDHLVSTGWIERSL
ncbi:MAG: hypothetical protein RLZZ450_2536 [Pseudomonadota bacterium]|jgi:predicted ATPase